MSGPLWYPVQIGGNGPDMWVVGRRSAQLIGRLGMQGRIDLLRGDDGEVRYFDGLDLAEEVARKVNNGEAT